MGFVWVGENHLIEYFSSLVTMLLNLLNLTLSSNFPQCFPNSFNCVTHRLAHFFLLYCVRDIFIISLIYWSSPWLVDELCLYWVARKIRKCFYHFKKSLPLCLDYQQNKNKLYQEMLEMPIMNFALGTFLIAITWVWVDTMCKWFNLGWTTYFSDIHDVIDSYGLASFSFPFCC